MPERCCSWCGQRFAASRRDAYTCSARCRQALSRAMRRMTRGQLQEGLELAQPAGRSWRLWDWLRGA